MPLPALVVAILAILGLVFFGKYVASIIGILLGYFLMSISGGGTAFQECVTKFNCNGGQIAGLILIIMSVIYLFKPSLFAKIFGG